MPVLAFLTTILFIPGIPNPATVPRWALLMLVVPVLWYRHPNRVTFGHLIGACFLAWAALSLIWTFNLYDGVRGAMLFGLLALIFCAAPQSLRLVYAWMAVALAINSAIVVAQFFGWHGISQGVPPAGLFFNRNFGGEIAAVVLVGAVASRLWLLVPGLLPTLALSGCRGAWMALGVAAIVLAYQYNRLAAAITATLTVIVGVLFWWYGTSPSLTQRTQLWLDIWDGFSFWGKGLGSFYTTFPEHATRLDAMRFRPSTAHFDLLNVAYELGPGVLLLLGLLVYALRYRPLRAEHYVLIVFLTEGLVGFPLYQPATSFLAALALGNLCRDRRELRVSLAWCRDRISAGVARARRQPGAVSSAPGGNAVAVRLPDADRRGVLLGGDEVLRGPRDRHSRYHGSSRDQPPLG